VQGVTVTAAMWLLPGSSRCRAGLVRAPQPKALCPCAPCSQPEGCTEAIAAARPPPSRPAGNDCRLEANAIAIGHHCRVPTRPLSSRERAVLTLLLRFDGGEPFAAQIDFAEALDDCGPFHLPPSIGLRVDATRADVAPHDPVVAGNVSLPVQGTTEACELFVFHDGGWLSYLECAPHDSDVWLSELPPPNEIVTSPRCTGRAIQDTAGLKQRAPTTRPKRPQG
jgi:hypothetical protein